MRQDTTLHGAHFGLAPAETGDVHSSARTHLGHVRMINEDRIVHRPDRGLWAIADGMGGYHDGDIAADMVALSLTELADRSVALTDALIVEALEAANSAIFAHSAKTGSIIGSTAVVLHITGHVATIHWVGDSRAYWIGKGRAEQVTQDHSVVQELLSAGVITPEQAMTHPKANIITRALGTDETIMIDRVEIVFEAGDGFLLCSDGLSRSLTTDQIFGECDKSADLILQAALARDGSDNVSFVLVRF